MNNENDKLYDLVEKIYIEVAGIKTDLNGVKSDLNDVKSDLNDVKTDLNDVKSEVVKTQIIIENDIKKDISALYDGYKLTYEKLQEHDRRFDIIENKLSNQEVEIKVIKGGK